MDRIGKHRFNIEISRFQQLKNKTEIYIIIIIYLFLRSYPPYKPG